VQLVQLQKAQNRFREHGLKVAAITYDSPAILGEFAKLHQIDYALMSDPQSEIIRSFGILDTDENPNNLPDFAKKGIALPGYFFVDRAGVVKEKFFGEAYYDRFTPNNVIAKLFPELLETSVSSVTAPHLKLALRQSDRDVVVGSRVTLAAEFTLPNGMHVYAHGAEKYKPTEFLIEAIDDTPVKPKMLKATRYPQSQQIFLPAIKERVSVYEGRFQIEQDLVVLPPREVQQKLNSPDFKANDLIKITVRGIVRYQACDAKTCYLPTEVPVNFELNMHQNDFNRASKSLQEKRN
jgi:peroxiredoxin